jgi:hypothetical protein
MRIGQLFRLYSAETMIQIKSVQPFGHEQCGSTYRQTEFQKTTASCSWGLNICESLRIIRLTIFMTANTFSYHIYEELRKYCMNSRWKE